VRARYKALASAAHIFSCNVCQLVREQRNTVKLPEHPEANGTASTLKSVACTTVKVVGMVKIHWAGTIGSQALMATIYVAYELVAGSLRSFPQDSWSLIQFRQVKRMIRGSGDETSFTYSQTLNRRDA